ncbi:FAD-dependent oxidoreductase [Nitratireductor soli]|uniref:FAD-dependent oxidoreductase n=1 Tax=Nitratireductor soli TaxID=1670619 RepID=UPI00065E65EB|nr:FAD-dependent oxidoreductase [Nitratireductor soli]
MSSLIDHQPYDVVVVGAGSAGVAAAISAAEAGARTALVEAGSMLGGELLTGMTIDGAINARGEQISGGILDKLMERCEALGGFVRKLNDWRLIQYFAYDPEIMKIAVPQLVHEAGVEVYLHTYAEDIVMHDGRIDGVMVRNKSGKSLLTAKVIIDCSGDGDICAAGGGEFLPAGEEERMQPVSMMFRMAGVDSAALLEFVRRHPEYVAVGESEAIRGNRTDAELVEEIRRQGQPCVFFKGDGPLLEQAIAGGELYPTALIMIQPTSEARREVCINSTRVTLDNPMRTRELSGALGELMRQVHQCMSFLQQRVPGFESATLSGLAPKMGIRETRRVAGDYVLTSQDVRVGRKREDGVAKGCHHIDIHQEGTGQVRIPVADGGSYDIPFDCLVPRNLKNVLVAGRCFSAEREAHASARVMGGCLAMGQACGVAAAMACGRNAEFDVRDTDVFALRRRLTEIGAVLEGTH